MKKRNKVWLYIALFLTFGFITGCVSKETVRQTSEAGASDQGKVDIGLIREEGLIFDLIAKGHYNTKELPDSSFKSTSETALVFGRWEILMDGKPVQFAAVGSKDMFYYFGIESEKGERYNVLSSRKEGYFVAALPPGKYFVNFAYGNTTEGTSLFTDITHSVSTSTGRITFNVIPSEAIYIGTIQTNVRPEETDEFYYAKTSGFLSGFACGFLLEIDPSCLSNMYKNKVISEAEYEKLDSSQKSQYEKRKRPRKYFGINSWIVKDDITQANNLFTSLYPSHIDPVKQLAEIKLNAENQK
ncbi:MAG: hypothetical protein HY758_09320 [Nitrospirae bacterium]|nr:hypothetical protein [Nitrospirota bacterium]